jgi:hypothetical protein
MHFSRRCLKMSRLFGPVSDFFDFGFIHPGLQPSTEEGPKSIARAALLVDFGEFW